MRRNIIIFLIICGLIGGVLGYHAKTANAAGVFGDPWQFLKEFIIKPLVRMIANSIENKLVNSINKQISNINGKTPGYITNWRNHFLDSQARGNDVFRSVLADTKSCGYFDENLKTAFGAEKYIGSIAGATVKNSAGQVVYQNKTAIPGLPSFQQTANCTLPSNLNVDLFKKDFSKGGWTAWNQLIQPQNNFFGAYSLALGEQQRQMTTEEKITMDSAVAGQGFLSQRLGVGNTGVGPSGCSDVQVGNRFSMVTINRCTFMGKEVTPAQILGKTAAATIDKKLGRPGAASELTDIVLSMFSAVLNATLNRVANFIAQNTYDQPPATPDPFTPAAGFSEQQFQPGSGDPNFNIPETCFQQCESAYTSCLNQVSSQGTNPQDENQTENQTNPQGDTSECEAQRTSCVNLCSQTSPTQQLQ